MTDLNQACSASVPGPNLCRNGFPQNSACRGHTCHGCGQPSRDVPMCLRNDLPQKVFSAWIDESGLPRFAQKGAPTNG
jgi:hypothetical protein